MAHKISRALCVQNARFCAWVGEKCGKYFVKHNDLDMGLMSLCWYGLAVDSMPSGDPRKRELKEIYTYMRHDLSRVMAN